MITEKELKAMLTDIAIDLIRECEDNEVMKQVIKNYFNINFGLELK